MSEIIATLLFLAFLALFGYLLLAGVSSGPGVDGQVLNQILALV
jgi:hypothetical protein